MSAPSSVVNAVRRCEAEIWQALLGVMRMTLENWAGSEVVRSALEGVSNVFAEQLDRANREGAKPWIH